MAVPKLDLLQMIHCPKKVKSIQLVILSQMYLVQKRQQERTRNLYSSYNYMLVYIVNMQGFFFVWKY